MPNPLVKVTGRCLDWIVSYAGRAKATRLAQCFFCMCLAGMDGPVARRKVSALAVLCPQALLLHDVSFTGSAGSHFVAGSFVASFGESGQRECAVHGPALLAPQPVAFDVFGKPGFQHAACSLLRSHMCQAANQKATKAMFALVSRLAVPSPQPLLQACNDVCFFTESARFQQALRSRSRGCVPSFFNVSQHGLARQLTKMCVAGYASSMQRSIS